MTGSVLQVYERGKKETCKVLRLGQWDCSGDMTIKRKGKGLSALGDKMICSVLGRKKIEILKSDRKGRSRPERKKWAASWAVVKEVVWNHESYDSSSVEEKHSKQSQDAPTTQEDQTKTSRDKEEQEGKKDTRAWVVETTLKGNLMRLKILKSTNISLGILAVDFRILRMIRDLFSVIIARRYTYFKKMSRLKAYKSFFKKLWPVILFYDTLQWNGTKVNWKSVWSVT